MNQITISDKTNKVNFQIMKSQPMYRNFKTLASAGGFFLIALFFAGSINAVKAQTANTRLYLTYDGSNSHLSRTAPAGATATSTAALFKQSASVTSSGYFKTGNGGLNTGTFSSNTTGTGIVSSANTYTPTGSSRGLIVTIGSASTANNAIDSVRFGTTKLTKLSQATDASNRKLEFWYLLNPSAAASTVTIYWPAGQTLEVMIGVTLLQNMDQLNPFGTVVTKTGAANVASSLNVPSDPGDVIIDAIAAVDNTMTIGAGQTQIFQAGTNSIDVASSYKASATGSATFTNMAWSGISSTNVTIGVAVKGNSNDVTWTLSPALCGDFTIKAGANITVKTSVTVASGTVSSDTIPMNVALTYGSTTIFHSDTAVRSAGLTTTGTTGILTWTTKIASDITIPSGSQPVLTMSNDYTAANLTVNYNATTTSSYIDLPATTYVNVNSLGLYSAVYPGGSLITSTTLGSTVYFRSVVSNPFGITDISGLTMKIVTPSGTVNAYATQVAISGCTATYEYAYTPTVAGSYSDTAVASQGTEGTVTHSVASSFTVLGPSLSITKTKTSPAGVVKYDPLNGMADTIIYNITVTNTGPSNVTNIPLKDSFNVSCMRFVSASVTPAGNAGGVVTWNNIASSPLAPSASVNITVRFVPIAACNPTLNKAAVVGATDQNSIPITNVSSSVSASVSHPPVAVGDSYLCIAGGSSLSVLSNDTDADISGFLSVHSSSYTVQIVSQPVLGSVSVSPDNTVLFNASGASENQLLSFAYRIIENSSSFQSNIATVSFRFSSVNNAPLANNDFAATTEEFPVIINVLNNDTDADGILQTLSVTTAPRHGSLVINADNTFTYYPFPGYTGQDSFSYRICDNGCPTPVQCATAKVIIGITSMMYACQNSTSVFSVPAVPGADTYTWTIPAGAAVTSPHTLDGSGKPVTTVPQISVNWNAVDTGLYEICVRTAGECGPGGEYCSDIRILKTYINPAVTNILCYGTKTGAINLSVAGGMLPYSYIWTGPGGYTAGIEDIAGLAAGGYNVTVTDHYGCTATQTGITVTQTGSALSISGTISDENTYGTANGSIDITPSGATPSYTYSWSNGSISEDLSGLYGGTYTVTVTDANGCTSSQSFTVNSLLAPLMISALTKTDILCPGGSTGTANLEVIGGTGSYTYVWSLNGVGTIGTSQDLTGLVAGTYHVKVYSGTDSASGSVTITQPLVSLSAAGTANNISCAGAHNGSIDAAVSGGTTPYTYLWSNGEITEDIAGLAPGTYTLTATDANGCVTTMTKSITTPSALLVTGNVTHSYCDPGNNGTIDITVSGGTPSYSYSWSNGAVTQDLSSLAPGDYSVVVTDGNGCTTGANYTIENNCLGIAKTIGSAPVNNGDGTYTLSYLIKIQNTGTSLLDSIQVKEDLTSTFSGAASFNVISVISGDFTVNPSFNGSTDKNLFASPLGSLPSGITSYVSLTVTATPGTKLGIYDNSAFTSAVDPEGNPVADTSQNGSLTDPDSNGNPGDNDIPTPVTFTENPKIGVAKTITAGPVNNGDGSYDITYTINVQNMGDVPLTNVRVTDNLSATFPGRPFSIISLNSNELSVNPSYNGSTSINLLTGADVMPINNVSSIILVIRVTPAAGGIYFNTAIGTGIGSGGTPVSDSSNNGLDPDPDGDANPGNNNIPTPVDPPFSENPSIGLAKALAGTPTSNGDGTYTLQYDFIVTNTGDVPLENVQVTDNLQQTFPGKVFSINSISSPDLRVNSTYNGSANQNMLLGNDTLMVGEVGNISLVLTVAPGSDLGPFLNQALASGKSFLGTNVTDKSHDGADVDPASDGPANDSTKTQVTFIENPSIGISKRVTGTVNNNNGTYTVNYKIIVTNTGDVRLNNVQVKDTLSLTFADAVSWSVISISSSPLLTANAAFNGSTDFNMLSSGGTLNAGQTDTISLSVLVTPGLKLAVYYNSATTYGNTDAGITVNDVSTDGVQVDPDGDNDPSNNNIPTPLTLEEDPRIAVAKNIVAGPVLSGGGYDLTYRIKVKNQGNVPLYNVQLMDDLSATFAGASSFSVSGLNIINQPINSTLHKNVAFNGSTDINLLGGTDTLKVGDSASLNLSVYVIPGFFGGPYNNTTYSLGKSPGGSMVLDESQDGANTDPNNDGYGTDNNEPTPVTFYENPQIGLAKNFDSMVDVGAGNFLVYMKFVISNKGDVGLDSLKIFDDIVTRFAALNPTGFVAESGTLFANGGWNGTAGSNILADGQTMAVGDSGTVYAHFTATPGSVLTIYNTAIAEGTGPMGGKTMDASTEGISTDPDGDGDPVNDSTSTAIVFNDIYIIGFVYHDINALSDNTVNGSGTNISGVMYANLVGTNGLVIASVPVNSAGSYAFTSLDGVAINTTYTIIITDSPKTVGDSLSASSLPSVWKSSGENLGAGVGNDGTVDGKLTVTTSDRGLTYADFGINMVPLAFNDSNSTNQNTAVTASAAINDTISGDGGNTWSLIGTDGGAANGTVNMNPDGIYTYTPDHDYFGVDTFYYQVCDANNDCDSARVIITIIQVDDQPEANTDYVTTNEDTPIIGASVTGNDVPSLDGGNTYNNVCPVCTNTSNGALTFNSNGTYNYTPNPNFNGVDSFVYQICDIDGDCDTALVYITVNPVDDLPVANTDYNSVNEDTPITGASVTGNDVLSGDGGNTYNNVCPVCTTTPNGTLTFYSNGTYDYTPNANFNGLDSFIYQICDIDGDCDTTVVYITVNPVDDLPVANTDYNNTNEDTPIIGASVTGNDVPSGDGGNSYNNICPACTTTPNGTLTFNSDGTYDYTPNPNFNGVDSFVYQICDMDGDCDTSKVYITVSPVDDFPIANVDYNSTNEDIPIIGASVTGNDIPSGDGGNTYNNVCPICTSTGHGTLTFNTNGTYNYSPNANFNGLDSFIYQICDVDGDCDTARVIITIIPVDDFPVAVSDYDTTAEDTPIIINVCTNDSFSGDGGNTTYDISIPFNGNLFRIDGCHYEYVPNPDYYGDDMFSYDLCDVDGDCSTATVFIHVGPVDDKPLANIDYNSTDEDTPIIGASVTGNDVPSGDGGNSYNNICPACTTTPNGTLIFNSDGTYDYTPNPNFNGVDSFVYQICDIDGDCDTAVVYITVNSVDDLPLANVDYNSTDEDTPITGASVIANDVPSGDGGNTYNNACPICTSTGHGTLTFNTNGTYNYSPNANFNGLDSFIYQICDVDGDCDTARVIITIIPVDDFPVAVNDSSNTDEDMPVNINVCTNDTSSGDGGNIWFMVSDASNGSVFQTGPCIFKYTPDPNFNGKDTFYYRVCDIDGDCDTAMAVITIDPVDDLPVAFNDRDTTNEDTPVIIDVCANDILSGDGGNATVNLSDPLHGTLVQIDGCHYEYTPDPNYNGNDHFTYDLCDVDGDCSTATVFIRIESVNDLPVAEDDHIVTTEETPIDIEVCINDTESPEGGNTYSKVSDPGHGHVVFNPPCTYKYIPDNRFVGMDTFYYRLCDVDGDCDTAMVVIEIDTLPVSDCRWCNKGSAIDIVGHAYGSVCEIPDIVVDVRLPWLPVDPYKVSLGYPATGSIQEAINYVNMHGDPTPGDGQILIGVTANDCEAIPLCGDPYSRSAVGDNPYAVENVIVNNMNTEQLNIIGCSQSIHANDPSLPVFTIQNSIGPVMLGDFHTKFSNVEGFLVKSGNAGLVTIRNGRIMNNDIGVRIQDNNVLVTSIPELSNNRIGILMEASGSTVNTISNARNNMEAAVRVTGNSNSILKVAAGQSGGPNGTGIIIDGNNNTISENIANYNIEEGIRITGTNNIVDKNTADRNGGHGINADQAIGAFSARFSNNSANINNLQGIRACGQIDFGGNTGSGNLGSPQVVFNCAPASVIISTAVTTVCANTAVTFTATATNIGANPFYQWKVNGINVGTNSTNYTTNSLSNGDQVSCMVTATATCCVTGSPATSNILTMTVNPPSPLSVNISASPSASICTGSAVIFTASVINGGSDQVYQWKRNGANVGSNSSTFASTSLVNGDLIWCVVTSNATCITGNPAASNIISMTVSAKVTPSVAITASPSNIICSGTSVTFTASPVNGGLTPSYQWKVNGINAGTNSATFTTSTLTHNDKVTCVMTTSNTCVNALTATSNTITMSVTTSVMPSVSISVSPSNSICAGSNVTFTATAVNGGTAPSFQWRVNGMNVGVNASSFSSNTLNNGDQVTCMLTSSIQCVTNNAVISNTITMNVMTVATPSASITASPSNVICSGTSVTFTAALTNAGSLNTYQWRRNGVIVGTNSPTYTVSNLANMDQIWCVATVNSSCVTSATATSNVIIMTVNPVGIPSVSISASPSTTVCAATAVTFTATPVNGGTSPSFQWRLNGNVVGSNSPAYSQSSWVNGDMISCIMISNSPCVTTLTATSNVLTMNVSASVTPSVSISASPSGNITAGTNVTFTASPVNGGSPSYQWKVNNVNVGTNASTYSSSSLANGDQVMAVMTSSLGCVTTNPVNSNAIVMSVTPMGIAKFITVDISTDRSYRYDASFNLLSSSPAFASNSDASDVCWSGVNYLVMDKADKVVYNYGLGGAAGSRILRDPAGSNLSNPAGITLAGDEMWVADGGRKRLYRYSYTSAFSGTTVLNAGLQISFNSLNGSSEGLTTDGTYLYVLDNSKKQVFRYLRTSPYTSVGSRVIRNSAGAIPGNLMGITLDGSDVYIVDNGQDKAYKFSLSSLFFGTGNILPIAEFRLNTANANATGIAVIGAPPIARAESNAETITFNESGSVIAYPNPFKDQIRFRIVPPETGRGKLQLLDLQGRLLQVVIDETMKKGVPVDISIPIRETLHIPMIYYFIQGDNRYRGKLIPGK